MIVSAAHSADVVLRGRRREIRKQYRIDVPIEFQQVARQDLAPAIEIDFASHGSVVVSTFAGRLWRPHLPEERREQRGTIDFPGRYAEVNAMTVAEMAAWAGGVVTHLQRGFTHDDPLQRPRGIYTSGYNGRWIAAQDLPVLADDDVKSVLWSDRPAIEHRLRQSAERILIVDGKVWTELGMSNAGGARSISGFSRRGALLSSMRCVISGWTGWTTCSIGLDTRAVALSPPAGTVRWRWSINIGSSNRGHRSATMREYCWPRGCTAP
jgi:hypothetical protein